MPVDAIALGAFEAAELQPGGQYATLALEDAQQNLFMVAGQEYRGGRRRVVGAKPLDHAGGLGAPVDEIAEKHDEGLPRIPRRPIGLDLLQGDVEQVEAPMDVADGVGTRAGLAAGWRDRLGPFEDLLEKNHAVPRITGCPLSPSGHADRPGRAGEVSARAATFIIARAHRQTL